MKLSLKLKPSLLGQYYEKQCDKSLVYYAVDKSQYKKLGWVEPQNNPNNAAAMAGNEWEKLLYDRLAADDTCQLINLKQDNQQEVTLKDTVAALRNLTEKEVTFPEIGKDFPKKGPLFLSLQDRIRH